MDQPLKFGPSTANGYLNNNDFNLDDLFSDDFFPDDLNFARLLEDTEAISSSGRFGSASSEGSSSPVVGSSSSSKMMVVPDGSHHNTAPIMVPPRMPVAIPVKKEGVKGSSPVGKGKKTVEDMLYQDSGGGGGGGGKSSSSSSSAAAPPKRKGKQDVEDISEEERVERRERNREHAKRSQILLTHHAYLTNALIHHIIHSLIFKNILLKHPINWPPFEHPLIKTSYRQFTYPEESDFGSFARSVGRITRGECEIAADCGGTNTRKSRQDFGRLYNGR